MKTTKSIHGRKLFSLQLSLFTIGALMHFSSSAQITFGPEVIINGNADNARWVEVIDLDGDGDMDVLSASQNDHRIAWYESDGGVDPLFTQHDITTTLNSASGVVAADFDGDGDIDVAASSMTNTLGRVVWFQNDGSQNFNAINIETSLDRVHSITKDDIDGDGDIDLLAPIRDVDQLRLYVNDGLGNFTASAIISGTAMCNSPRTIWVEDIDGDGDRDVAYQAMLSNAIYWGENDGSLNFTPHLIHTGNISDCKFVSAGDMDNDGDIDILSAAAGSDRMALHRNDGSENFAYELISSTELNPFCIVPVDLDFDGDLDLLTALKGENHFAWYVNDGTGNFGPKNIISGASTCLDATYIKPEDLDADGDIDAIVSAQTDDDVSWFDSPTPLPVEGLWLTGEKLERKVDLTWTTQSEINNDYFNVMRSLDAQNFYKIGEVDGNGTTTLSSSYSFLDESPLLGINYYRLQQVDFDGTTTLSNTVAFEFGDDLERPFICLNPNPASAEAIVQFNGFENGQAYMNIYNAIGQFVKRDVHSVNVGLNAVEVDLTNLPSGVYFLEVSQVNQPLRQVKFIKN